MFTFNQRLLRDIDDYCKINSLDINTFANNLLKKNLL